jgi:hypothetical protein
MTIAFVFQKDITRFISVSQIKANYRIMGSKYTGFHVNFRAFFVDEIKVERLASVELSLISG